MNICNIINAHQRNKNVENWGIGKYLQMYKCPKKGTIINNYKRAHDVSIHLESNKHTIKSF